jgi:hypothetical protein
MTRHPHVHMIVRGRAIHEVLEKTSDSPVEEHYRVAHCGPNKSAQKSQRGRIKPGKASIQPRHNPASRRFAIKGFDITTPFGRVAQRACGILGE